MGTNRCSYSEKALMEARMSTKCSIRCLLAASMIVLIFSGVDCKHNPVGPPPGADTTSNNFTFQTYTFGGNAGSCYLQDVAIINDTDIWAVGAVYLDSADGAPDPFPYNAVHWDGKEWQLSRIYFSTVCGQSDLTPYPTTALFALSGTDIWMAGAGQVVRFNGHSQSAPVCVAPPISFTINGLWGNNANSIYAVGYGGTIAHYTSGTWTKIATGTDLSFDDIYGSGGQILAVAYDAAEIHGYSGALFSIQGNGATQLSINPIQLPSALYGVWFVPNQRYYIVGEGVYEKRSLSDTSWTPLPITGAATTGACGSDTSDVFIVSSTGDFLHYNGVRWTSLRAETGLSNGGYSRVAVNGNTVVGVGQNNVNFGQAIITMGIRH